MEFGAWLAYMLLTLDLLLRLALCVRVIYRRTPVPDTLSWLLLLLLVPLLSWILYLFIGTNRVGSRRARRYERFTQTIEQEANALWSQHHSDWTVTDPHFKHLAALAVNISGLPTLRGNSLELIADSAQMLARLIEDIDAARHHCHLCYYIWEPDAKGTQLAQALIRARQRGVACRIVVDSVGSAPLLKSELWDQMQRAGVSCVEALPANLLRALFARVDLRNHRKIAVIDGAIAYCGSQNITEENFRPRLGTKHGSKHGPWIDATVRLVGPAAHALQITFLRDYSLDSETRLTNIAQYLPDVPADGPSIVHLIPSGPGPRPQAIHQAFMAMLYAAREEIIITTPYFVPDEATKIALQGAALRGVHVTLVVPHASDSKLVAAAARSHYEDLLDAGIHIQKHQRGLLHAKAATVDRQFAVIGSANFDMRSFWLNFEATLFVYDPDFAGLLRFLQYSYISESVPINPHAWKRRPRSQRFLENCAQLFGPLL
jgi:cardiolipin synthase A/B